MKGRDINICQKKTNLNNSYQCQNSWRFRDNSGISTVCTPIVIGLDGTLRSSDLMYEINVNLWSTILFRNKENTFSYLRMLKPLKQVGEFKKKY